MSWKRALFSDTYTWKCASTYDYVDKFLGGREEEEKKEAYFPRASPSFPTAFVVN